MRISIGKAAIFVGLMLFAAASGASTIRFNMAFAVPDNPGAAKDSDRWFAIAVGNGGASHARPDFRMMTWSYARTVADLCCRSSIDRDPVAPNIDGLLVNAMRGKLRVTRKNGILRIMYSVRTIKSKQVGLSRDGVLKGTPQPVSLPEPGTFSLLAMGLAGIAGFRRRKSM